MTGISFSSLYAPIREKCIHRCRLAISCRLVPVSEPGCSATAIWTLLGRYDDMDKASSGWVRLQVVNGSSKYMTPVQNVQLGTTKLGYPPLVPERTLSVPSN